MYKYELFIPSQYKDMIQAAEHTFTLYYGGCTTQQASGTWRNKSNIPEYENITIIMALADIEDDRPIIEQAELITNYTSEEEVLWTKHTNVYKNIVRRK